MKKALILLILFFAFGATVSAQQRSLSLGSVSACADMEVLVPVTGINLTNIGSLTLYIQFDSTKTRFLNLENISSQLSGNMNVNFIPATSTLAVVWSNTNGASFNQTKLFDIRYHYIHGNPSLQFTSACEISNVSLEILSVSYLDGLITPGNPNISQNPHDTIIISGGHATFSAVALNAASYLWKVSNNSGLTFTDLTDNNTYAGTHSAQLQITNVPGSFNKFQYLCTLNRETCSTNTAAATLHVDSTASVFAIVCQANIKIYNAPNPVREMTTICYSLPAPGNVFITIRNLNGSVLYNLTNGFLQKGEYQIPFNATRLESGTYLFCLEYSNEELSYTNCGKLIKE